MREHLRAIWEPIEARLMFAIARPAVRLGISLNWVFCPITSWRQGLPLWLHQKREDLK